MTKIAKTFSSLLLIALMGLTSQALADDSIQSADLDSLGANDDIVERARALDPNSRFSIVQNRVVDRYNRLEVALNAGMVAGGESYLTTNNLGGTLGWHFSPRWSVGISYDQYRYGISPEGQRVFAAADARAAAGYSDYEIPQINYPDSSGLVHVSWYPIYGKTNLFDITTAQFDFYLQGGVGQMQTRSPFENSELMKESTSPLYSVGAGMGLWLAQNLSTRLEVRHQRYEDSLYTGARQINWTTLNASIGFLL